MADRSDTRSAVTRSWVERATGQVIERTTPLVGGMSSSVARHDLADGTTIVSRHITDTEWLRREPYLISAEAAALILVAESPVRAPNVLATDPPAGRLAMTHLPGEMRFQADELVELAPALARVAAEIHAVPLPDDHDLPPWRPWAPAQLSPPSWGNDDTWRDAIACYQRRAVPEPGRAVLLHRDLHPLNILWHNGEPGIVDWVNACVGHPHAELGHCRWNLTVLAGLECADRFLAAYLEVTGGATYDSYWDIVPAMSFLPGPHTGDGWHAVGRTDLTPDVIAERTDQFLAAALSTGAPSTLGSDPNRLGIDDDGADV